MNSLVNRETGEIVQNQVLSPVQLDLVVQSFHAYQNACEKLLTELDYQTIQGKQFKKKSAWRKLATAYCISTRIISERRDELNSGAFVYHFTVRAEAGNGRYAEGVGSCSSDEKGLAKTEHNTRSIAETRATNRAISNLIGAGEVSAEEVENETTASFSEVEKSKKYSVDGVDYEDFQHWKNSYIKKNREDAGLSSEQVVNLAKNKFNKTIPQLKKEETIQLVEAIHTIAKGEKAKNEL